MGAFFVFALWQASAQAFCPAPGALPVARVQQVVDGDTLRLSDGRRVRLIGINTPETARRGQSAEPLADAARRRLQALVKASDGQVQLRVGRQGKDAYGRTLAHAYGRDGRNFEAQLLSEGLGYQVAIAPNVALLACQQAAERQARGARLGLWRHAPLRQAGQVDKGGFTLVTGQVMAVQRNRGGLWIELRGGVVLRIAPKLLAQFDGARLERLKGRHVEARGWVVDRAAKGGLQSGQSRWLLPITHPTMLETLRK